MSDAKTVVGYGKDQKAAAKAVEKNLPHPVDSDKYSSINLAYDRSSRRKPNERWCLTVTYSLTGDEAKKAPVRGTGAVAYSDDVEAIRRLPR